MGVMFDCNVANAVRCFPGGLRAVEGDSISACLKKITYWPTTCFYNILACTPYLRAPTEINLYVPSTHPEWRDTRLAPAIGRKLMENRP